MSFARLDHVESAGVVGRKLPGVRRQENVREDDGLTRGLFMSGY